MTSGHILTIVQNMIVGQNPFWNKPPGIALRNIRNPFTLLHHRFEFFTAGCGSVAIRHLYHLPGNIDVRPFTSTEGIRSWDW